MHREPRAGSVLGRAAPVLRLLPGGGVPLCSSCGAHRLAADSTAAAAAPGPLCSWLVLFLFGHMRDFYRKKIWGGRAAKKEKEGYAPIRQDYEVCRGEGHWRCWDAAGAGDAWARPGVSLAPDPCMQRL